MVTLAKRTPYVVITEDDGQIVLAAPQLATERDREEQAISAFVECLHLYDVFATGPADAVTQVLAALDAEARGMTAVWLDRI